MDIFITAKIQRSERSTGTFFVRLIQAIWSLQRDRRQHQCYTRNTIRMGYTGIEFQLPKDMNSETRTKHMRTICAVAENYTFRINNIDCFNASCVLLFASFVELQKLNAHCVHILLINSTAGCTVVFVYCKKMAYVFRVSHSTIRCSRSGVVIVCKFAFCGQRIAYVRFALWAYILSDLIVDILWGSCRPLMNVRICVHMHADACWNCWPTISCQHRFYGFSDKEERCARTLFAYACCSSFSFALSYGSVCVSSSTTVDLPAKLPPSNAQNCVHTSTHTPHMAGNYVDHVHVSVAIYYMLCRMCYGIATRFAQNRRPQRVVFFSPYTARFSWNQPDVLRIALDVVALCLHIANRHMCVCCCRSFRVKSEIAPAMSYMSAFRKNVREATRKCACAQRFRRYDHKTCTLFACASTSCACRVLFILKSKSESHACVHI